MKTSIVLSGNHDPTDFRYKGIDKSLQRAGYRTIFHTPDLRLGSIHKLVNELLEKLPSDKEKLTFLGFSMGAMIALVASSKVEVENLILCSPSGYFKEYESFLTAEDAEWAKQHLADFEDWSARDIVRRAKVAHGYIIAGEKELAEWPEFKRWIDDLRSQTSWPTTLIPGTAHEIEAPKYQNVIYKIIQNLG